jgi:hypothetical protein
MSCSNRATRILLVCIGVALGGASGANAQIVSEIGARYWYSAGQTDFDLYDSTGATLVSRLTYDGLDAHAGEIFGKIQDIFGTFMDGLFAKAYAGLGAIPGGSLNDEDFPPVVVPYSSTISPLDDGDLAYFNGDVGFLVHKSPAGSAPYFELGLFTGYHYWNEQVDAFGCTQIGGAGSGVCVPTIATSVAVISNEATWHSWRVGIVGAVELSNRVSLTGEAAWVPYTSLDNVDNHHLRPAINPLPSDGTGHGVQLEAILDVAVTERFSVGIGGRYWRLGRTDGRAHFEQTPGGGVAQVVKFESERYGAFVQATLDLP